MTKDLKVGVIIPDRGDRPEFIKNCFRIISAQTIKPDIICHFNEPPISNDFDITYRYRMGYEFLKGKCDVVLFIENDDWYASNYIETMVNEWINRGKPDIIGTNHTIYYNIRFKAWFTMRHNSRSMAMSTLIKSGLNFKWCADNQPYTDIHLWNTIKNKVIFEPKETICMGIKHGIGKLGGYAHVDRQERFINKDSDLSFLKSKVDKESFEFYANI
jgi:hypothetical protein